MPFDDLKLLLITLEKYFFVWINLDKSWINEQISIFIDARTYKYAVENKVITQVKKKL